MDFVFLLVKCVKICLSFRKNTCSVLHLGPQSLKYLSFGPLQKKLLNFSLKDKALEKARLVKKISRLTELFCPKWLPPAMCGYSVLLPPPQNNGDAPVPRPRPYINLPTSSRSIKLGAKDSQSGCCPPHAQPKMHQVGMNSTPGPGIREKMKKWINNI